MPDLLESGTPLRPPRDDGRPSLWDRLPRVRLREDDEPPVRRPRSIGRRWVGLALVAGLVLGGLFIHSYDTRLTEQSRRDTIALAARVVPIQSPGGQGRDSWLLRVVVSNRGATALRLRSAQLADTPLRSSLRTVSRDISLPPGRDTWISMDVSGACAGGGLTRAPTTLTASVTPAGRPTRSVRVALADDTSLMLTAARQTCVDADFGLWSTAEQQGTIVIDDRGLFVPMRFRLNWTPPWDISAVRSEGPGLAATVDGLPVHVTNGLTPIVTVRWSLTDCVQAKALNYTELRLRTTLTRADASRAVEVTTTVSGGVIAALGIFLDRACR
ncbi:hypothetical protein [Cryptosporangium phraense]|uniref:Uncharacterized protein n=1 Tax=Cryptosporangium phraense TaxID=2593070 RepID=A0A545AGP7_9ACTN|nr:hypothetical protein [Cryptosporangium phraense]TQS40499.1 hypothetical protein FL583_34745 [Cryptosporangium phraense]